MTVTDADIAVVTEQLGRTPRGVLEVSYRTPDGQPAVIKTAPKLADGTPFPTLYYLTDPRLTAEASRLEVAHVMKYIKQEARRRFGVVDEGETAYRIIDPQIKPEDQLTTDGQKEEDSRDWYEVLWDSVAEPPKEEAPSEQVNHLPIEPAPEEKADVR